MLKIFSWVLLIVSFANGTESLIDPSKPWVIVFLDIDGVLYREPARHNFHKERKAKMIEIFGKLDKYWSYHYDRATAYYFDPQAVTFLEDFIHQTSLIFNVGIVISSAWREGRTLEELREVFSSWPFSRFIIDRTVGASFSGYTQEEIKNFRYGIPLRADQIKHWLCNHSEMDIANFVIFDDQDGDLSVRFPDQFVRVDKSYLSLENIEAAMSIIHTPKNLIDN
ncbi:MAG TPA: HAD domain-containing protein [Chlamydiales bacterium]|nr:HAD domain-containing protein [Chlamydiales bacterium]